MEYEKIETLYNRDDKIVLSMAAIVVTASVLALANAWRDAPILAAFLTLLGASGLVWFVGWVIYPDEEENQ